MSDAGLPVPIVWDILRRQVRQVGDLVIRGVAIVVGGYGTARRGSEVSWMLELGSIFS